MGVTAELGASDGEVKLGTLFITATRDDIIDDVWHARVFFFSLSLGNSKSAVVRQSEIESGFQSWRSLLRPRLTYGS